MKKVIIFIAVLAVFAGVCNISAYSQMKCKKCGMGSMSKGAKEIGDMEKVFNTETNLILANKKELDLTDKQIDTIKKLKSDTAKTIIKLNAQKDVIAVDISQEVYEDPINTGVMNELIGKKHDIKKEKAKTLIAALNELRMTLTDEQKKKLKAL